MHRAQRYPGRPRSTTIPDIRGASSSQKFCKVADDYAYSDSRTSFAASSRANQRVRRSSRSGLSCLSTSNAKP